MASIGDTQEREWSAGAGNTRSGGAHRGEMPTWAGSLLRGSYHRNMQPGVSIWGSCSPSKWPPKMPVKTPEKTKT